MQKKTSLFFLLIVIGSCIDRLEINAPNAECQMVVDGFITDEPVPHTVNLLRTRKLVDFSPLS